MELGITGGFGNQLAWLEADLKAAVLNRAERPWILVGGHRPMYSTSSDAMISLVWPNATLRLREQVETMFYNYGVDFYLCGYVFVSFYISLDARSLLPDRSRGNTVFR